MKKLLLSLLSVLLTISISFAQKVTYTDSWDQSGFTLKSQATTGITINYSVGEFTMNDIDIRGEAMKTITIPGIFLPNDEGAPDLPGSGRYIALPQGAEAVLKIVEMRTETYKNVNIAPAFRIPKTTERGPLEYNKNTRIYNTNAFYPAQPVKLSELTRVRGVDAVILGVTPFQYNPVTKELVVIRDLKVQVEFKGGNGQFGEERLRSYWWDPILSDLFMNYASLSKIDYSKRLQNTRATGFEYLIIAPNDPVFLAWADTIRRFRTMQGIPTGVVTTTDVGGNNATVIENYVNNAYNTWDIPPAAILLLGDYGTSGSTIVSPMWDSYCVSDHIYADVDADDEEEIVFARMTARNASELQVMCRKFLDYETNPPTSPDFYDHPITALGWQTVRWFQICSEVVGGFFKNAKGKNPVRINAVYEGNPNVDPWSTANNTTTVTDYFGPNGLDYIPASPATLGGWTGGNATMVNNAINAGAFMLQHRDHGYEYGWGEPDYSTTNIPGLHNTDLCFVFSINCLTGKYDYSDECFAEKMHRYTYNNQPSGALGLIAASEVSYSFVNDAYAWGMYDNMWPEFMPLYGSTPAERGELPAFGNAAGKFFLKYSNWPYNSGDKEVTYNLFHHHGDAFLCLYSEVPQNLTVTHDNILLAGLTSFTISANEGSLIALSVNGELIGTAIGTGSSQDVTIAPQYPPAMVDVVITKQNYYRYHAVLQTIPPSGPYVINQSCTINDQGGNNNGQLDYGETVTLTITLKNVGSEDAQNVSVTINSQDEFVSIINGTAVYGTIPANQTASVPDAFSFMAAGNVPNGHNILFSVAATNGDTTWNSSFSVQAHAPILNYVSFTISDPTGNNNGLLDPGETADIVISLKNTGSADAYNVYGLLSTSDPYITIVSDSAMYGDLDQNATSEQSYTVSAKIMTPAGHEAPFDISFTGEYGTNTTGTFTTIVGQFPIAIIDLDGNHNSGNKMKAAVDEWRIGAEYMTSIPADVTKYNTIFLCLGTYNQNHILSATEAAPFFDFLSAGGNLYMEGADTWYYDQQYTPTPLHPLFKITGLSDGSGDLGTIKGKAGTFTENMNYYFNGDNSYIDHIVAVSPGVVIFDNLSPLYSLAVAHNAGAYKTIGSVFEFGGLTDNINFTKKDLMLKYLEFFGMQPITVAPAIPEGPATLCGSAEPGEYMTHPVSGAQFYMWEINPPTAGTIEGWDTAVTVNWAPDFAGSAWLKVCGMNPYGIGPDSDSLQVTLYALPTAQLTLDTNTICEGDTTNLNVTLTGVSPWHLTINVGGGTLQFDVNKPWIDPIPLYPIETLEIQVLSVIDGTGCENTPSETITLNVNPLPGVPSAPSGPVSIDTYASTQVSYTTGGGSNGTSCGWMIDPENAGTITAGATEMTCSVDWSASFTGQASVKVKSVNDCGEGSYSQALLVNVYTSLGIDEQEAGIGVKIYPNPNEGNCQVILTSQISQQVNIKVLNTFGSTIWSSDGLQLNKILRVPLNLNASSEGMYILKIEAEKGTINRKILIK